MNRRRLALSVAILAAIVAFAVPTFRAGAAEDVDRMIATAKTASDHEAIVNYYKQQAAEARTKADMHSKMAEQYSMSGIGNQATKTHFHQHCEALIRSYQTQASEYDALAKAHQDLAAKAGK